MVWPTGSWSPLGIWETGIFWISFVEMPASAAGMWTVLGLADSEVFDGGIEAGDHLTHHAGELDGLAAVHGGIELGSIVKAPGVVDLTFLPLLLIKELLSKEKQWIQSNRTGKPSLAATTKRRAGHNFVDWDRRSRRRMLVSDSGSARRAPIVKGARRYGGCGACLKTGARLPRRGCRRFGPR